MVKVKTLAPHRNPFGESQMKGAGDEYELPENAAEHLVAEKLVERVPVEEPKAKRG